MAAAQLNCLVLGYPAMRAGGACFAKTASAPARIALPDIVQQPATQFLLIWLFQQSPIGCGSVFLKQPGKVRGSFYLRVRHGATCGTETEQGLECSHGCLATIVAKNELIQINLQVIAAHAMIGSNEPLL